MKGFWNRAGRRSGGEKPIPIKVPGLAGKLYPVGTRTHRDCQSIQCFEGRHKECPGHCEPFFPGACECECHKAKPDRA